MDNFIPVSVCNIGTHSLMVLDFRLPEEFAANGKLCVVQKVQTLEPVCAVIEEVLYSPKLKGSLLFLGEGHLGLNSKACTSIRSELLGVEWRGMLLRADGFGYYAYKSPELDIRVNCVAGKQGRRDLHYAASIACYVQGHPVTKAGVSSEQRQALDMAAADLRMKLESMASDARVSIEDIHRAVGRLGY